MNEKKYLKCSCGKCRGHIEYPIEAIGSTVACPHCGAETLLVIENAHEEGGSKSWKIWLLVLIGVCIFSLVALEAGLNYARRKIPAMPASPAMRPGAAATTEPTPAATAPAMAPRPIKSVADLKVGDITLEKNGDSSLVFAMGSMTNTSDLQRFGVRIELELRDARGTPVDTARDYLGVLEPHKAWTFRALVLKPGAATATVKSIKEDE